MFPNVEFLARALNWGLIWPKAWTWMSDAINNMAQLGHEPDMLCPYELLCGKWPLRAPLPFLMPGFHHAGRQSKMEAKGQARSLLNCSRDHSRDCYKVLFRASPGTPRTDMPS